jgi:hypothetical protein
MATVKPGRPDLPLIVDETDDEIDSVIWPGSHDHEQRDVHDADEPLEAWCVTSRGPGT